MNEKILGYSLVILGIAVILFAGVSVYSVFTGRTKPFGLFNFPSISIDIPQAGKTEVISARTLNDSSDMIAYVVLMSFIAGIGSRLSTIGAMLVRPINVKLKAREVKQDKTTG
jgi:hypothetical protein